MRASDQNQDEIFAPDNRLRGRKIRYAFHFQTLALAALIFWLSRNVELGARTFNFEFFPFALMGFLHAACLVISLRDLKAARPIIALCFITLVALWSAMTPIVGLWSSVVWLPLESVVRRGHLGAFVIFVTGSAAGSAGYWLLVRLFWLKSLRPTDCLRTAALCVASTLLSSLMMQLLSNGSWVILTAPWWFAFSLSLYWSERTTYRSASIAEPMKASQ